MIYENVTTLRKEKIGKQREEVLTIKDIAKMAGVSVSTVSRVINDSGYVKEEKKDLIKRIIAETGYRPSAVARNLTDNSSDTIGLVMPERVNPFFMKIYDGVAGKADERQMSVLFFATADDEERQTEILEYLKSQRVRGVLITPGLYYTEHTVESLKRLEDSGIPVVLIDRNIEGGAFDAILINNRDAVYNAVKSIIASGHRKIAVVACPDRSRKGTAKLDGYKDCMNEAGIEIKKEWIYEGEFTPLSGYEACEYFMGLKEELRPTAVIAFSSSGLIGSMKFFNESGLRIGKDVKLVGFDDIGTVADIGFDVTVIERPMKIMGEMAFELLMEKIHDPSRGKIKEIILSTQIRSV